jgi:2-keto-3-deoxy-L-rhamnonate aldolase RhmA
MTVSLENPAKKKLAEGGLVLCMGIRQARTIDMMMVVGACGFDSFYVDMEHSPISHETAASLCAGAIGLGLTPVVRIAGHNGHDATRILDGGALGLIFPHVNNAKEAAALVDACKHAPVGHRSVAGTGPGLGYRSMPLGEVNKAANDRTMLIFMLETPEAISNADSIAAVPGFDVLLIGSNDLCAEMGIPGQLRHEKLRQAQDFVAAACKKHGKVYGIAGLSADFELQAEFIARGARFVMTGSEVNYFAAAARQEAERFRKIKLG